MGTIVVHAGMHKTGSSSIQRWLRDNAERLSSESGIAPVTVEVDPAGEARPAVNRGRVSMNSWTIARHLKHNPADRERLAATLLAGLDAIASAHPTIVISSEGLSRWVAAGDEPLLGGLDDLASRHRVRLACYVRPQHTTLESAWRSRGFRTGRPPSEFLESWSERLHHFRTLERVRAVAPRLGFTPRPYRRELLDGGDVVTDFASAFLGLEPAPGEAAQAAWRNRALPLELANAMSTAPPEILGDRRADAQSGAIRALRSIAARLEVPDSERAERSRAILRRACHARFESGNRRLISELAWPVDEWIPAPEGPAGPGEDSFEPLDELWRPDASPAELALLHRAVAELAARLSPRPSPGG